MVQTNFKKSDVIISIHLDQMDESTYGVYVFVNDNLVMSSYGSKEWMSEKYESACNNMRLSFVE